MPPWPWPWESRKSRKQSPFNSNLRSKRGQRVNQPSCQRLLSRGPPGREQTGAAAPPLSSRLYCRHLLQVPTGATCIRKCASMLITCTCETVLSPKDLLSST